MSYTRSHVRAPISTDVTSDTEKMERLLEQSRLRRSRWVPDTRSSTLYGTSPSSSSSASSSSSSSSSFSSTYSNLETNPPDAFGPNVLSTAGLSSLASHTPASSSTTSSSLGRSGHSQKSQSDPYDPERCKPKLYQLNPTHKYQEYFPKSVKKLIYGSGYYWSGAIPKSQEQLAEYRSDLATRHLPESAMGRTLAAASETLRRAGNIEPVERMEARLASMMKAATKGGKQNDIQTQGEHGDKTMSEVGTSLSLASSLSSLPTGKGKTKKRDSSSKDALEDSYGYSDASHDGHDNEDEDYYSDGRHDDDETMSYVDEERRTHSDTSDIGHSRPSGGRGRRNQSSVSTSSSSSSSTTTTPRPLLVSISDSDRMAYVTSLLDEAALEVLRVEFSKANRGLIDLPTFVRVMLQQARATEGFDEMELTVCLCTAFSTVDQDADGLISWNELTSYAIDCGLRSTAATSVSAITMGAGNTSGGSGSSSLLGTGSSVSAAHRELSDHYVAAPVMSPAKSATVEKICVIPTHDFVVCSRRGQSLLDIYRGSSMAHLASLQTAPTPTNPSLVNMKGGANSHGAYTSSLITPSPLIHTTVTAPPPTSDPSSSSTTSSSSSSSSSPSPAITPSSRLNDILAMVYVPQFDWLLTASNDQTIRLWDAGESFIPVYDAHGRELRCGASQTALAWDPHTQVLYTGSDRTYDVLCWRVGKHTQMPRRSAAHKIDLLGSLGTPYTTLTSSSGGMGRGGRSNHRHGSGITSGFVGQGGRGLDGYIDGSIASRGSSMQSISSSTMEYVRSKLLAPPDHMGHTDIVTALQPLGNLGQLASASMDRTVCVWDPATGTRLHALRGHRNGLHSLAYNPDAHLLVSAGYGRSAVVWNPFWDRKLCTLQSSHTLVGVYAMPDSPQLITADKAGVVKVWDTRTFTCVQTIYVEDDKAQRVSDISAFAAIPSHKRLLSAGQRLYCHDALTSGESRAPRLADLEPTCAVIYSWGDCAFYTAAGKTIKVWEATTGVVSRVFRNITEHEITSMTMDETCKKLVIGDSSGVITVLSLLGTVLQRSPALRWGCSDGIGHIMHVPDAPSGGTSAIIKRGRGSVSGSLSGSIDGNGSGVGNGVSGGMPSSQSTGTVGKSDVDGLGESDVDAEDEALLKEILSEKGENGEVLSVAQRLARLEEKKKQAEIENRVDKILESDKGDGTKKHNVKGKDQSDGNVYPRKPSDSRKVSLSGPTTTSVPSLSSPLSSSSGATSTKPSSTLRGISAQPSLGDAPVVSASEAVEVAKGRGLYDLKDDHEYSTVNSNNTVTNHEAIKSGSQGNLGTSTNSNNINPPIGSTSNNDNNLTNGPGLSLSDLVSQMNYKKHSLPSPHHRDTLKSPTSNTSKFNNSNSNSNNSSNTNSNNNAHGIGADGSYIGVSQKLLDKINNTVRPSHSNGSVNNKTTNTNTTPVPTPSTSTTSDSTNGTPLSRSSALRTSQTPRGITISPRDIVMCVAASRDGNSYVAAAADGTLYVLVGSSSSAAGEKALKVVKESRYSSPISCCTASHAFDVALVGREDGSVTVISLQTHSIIATLRGHVTEITCVAILDPYPLALTADLAGNICLWPIRPLQTAVEKCLVRLVNTPLAQDGSTSSTSDRSNNIATHQQQSTSSTTPSSSTPSTPTSRLPSTPSSSSSTTPSTAGSSSTTNAPVPVTAATLWQSPTSAVLACGDADGVIKMWDLTGAIKRWGISPLYAVEFAISLTTSSLSPSPIPSSSLLSIATPSLLTPSPTSPAISSSATFGKMAAPSVSIAAIAALGRITDGNMISGSGIPTSGSGESASSTGGGGGSSSSATTTHHKDMVLEIYRLLHLDQLALMMTPGGSSLSSLSSSSSSSTAFSLTNPSDSHHAYTHSSGVTLFKGDIVLIKAWNAHSEAIKALCRVDEPADDPTCPVVTKAIATWGYDKYVCLWGKFGNTLGHLQQGRLPPSASTTSTRQIGGQVGLSSNTTNNDGLEPDWRFRPDVFTVTSRKAEQARSVLDAVRLTESQTSQERQGGYNANDYTSSNSSSSTSKSGISSEDNHAIVRTTSRDDGGKGYSSSYHRSDRHPSFDNDQPNSAIDAWSRGAGWNTSNLSTDIPSPYDEVTGSISSGYSPKYGGRTSTSQGISGIIGSSNQTTRMGSRGGSVSSGQRLSTHYATASSYLDDDDDDDVVDDDDDNDGSSGYPYHQPSTTSNPEQPNRGSLSRAFNSPFVRN